MKVIPKLLQGGEFARFFSSYLPVFGEAKPQLGSAIPAQRKEDTSKSRLTEKDLYSMLKDLDGLPNEVQALVLEFTSTLQVSNLLGMDTSDLATQYMQSLGKLRVALFNKSLYDNAYKEAEKNDALNDIAITTDGKVIVQSTTDGNLITLTPEQYAETRGDYAPITNSNLLWLRAHHPDYINNNTIFLTIENGIGLDLVHKMIKDRSAKLGSTTTDLERYISKDVIKGNELLEAALAYGPDGYYKWKESLTKTDQSYIQAALNYIYSTLPKNARTRLQLETQNGTVEEVGNLIQGMLISGTDYKQSMSFDYLAGASKNGNSENGDGDSLDKMDSNMALQFAKGQGYYSQITLNPGTPNGIIAHGVTVPVTDVDGKNLGSMAPVSELIKGEFGGILDVNNITVGGQPVPVSNLDGILLKDGKLTSIDYPCKEENGRIVPIIDPQVVRAKNDADKEIALKGINVNKQEDIANHYLEINDIYVSHGLDPAYDANGQPIGNWRRFAVANVYTDDNILGLGIFDNNSLMREITDQTEINNLMKKFNDEKFDTTDWALWPFDSKNRMFEGTMWIPILLAYTNIVSRTTKVGQVDEIDARLQSDKVLENSYSNINRGTQNLI